MTNETSSFIKMSNLKVINLNALHALTNLLNSIRLNVIILNQLMGFWVSVETVTSQLLGAKYRGEDANIEDVKSAQKCLSESYLI